MTVIDYTARDYEAVRAALLSRIPSHLPEWKSRSPNDFGIVMLELFAYAVDNMNYYADRVANEAFIGTAVLDSSVMDIARMVGYHIKGTQAAIGSVNFDLATTITKDYVIPAGTMLQTDTNDPTLAVVFTTTEDTAVTVGATQVTDVPIREGRRFSEILGMGSGGPGQTFLIPYDDLDVNSLEIKVSTFMWTQTPSLMNGTPTGRFYTIAYLSDRTWAVIFGDGISGAMPAPGEYVEATGRRSLGVLGNVEANTITKMMSPPIGVIGVTNPQPTSGGENRETIQQIRTSLPQAIQTVERAVTMNDYHLLAMSYPGVSQAQATALVYTNVTVYIVAIGGTPNDDLRAELQTYLMERSLVNVSVSVEKALLQRIGVNVQIYADPEVREEDVQVLVDATVKEVLHWSNPDLTFNMLLSVSHLYRALDKIPGVQHSVITAFWNFTDSPTPSMNQSLQMDIGEFPTFGTLSVTFIHP